MIEYECPGLYAHGGAVRKTLLQLIDAGHHRAFSLSVFLACAFLARNC